jgi:hypothetical protein
MLVLDRYCSAFVSPYFDGSVCLRTLCSKLSFFIGVRTYVCGAFNVYLKSRRCFLICLVHVFCLMLVPMAIDIG